MDTAASSVSSLTETLTSAKDAVIDFLATRAVVDFLKDAAEATEEWAFSIQKITQLTGLSAQSAAALAVVSREEGVSTDTVTTAMGRLSLVLANHPEKFKALGIAIKDAQGNLLPMQQILGNTVKGLDQFKQGADRDAAAASLLGRGMANLLPDMERLAPALAGPQWERAIALIKGMGLAIDQNGIARAREWEAAEKDLGIVFLGVENIIGHALLPVVKDFSDEAVKLASNGSLKRWAVEAAQAFLSVGIAIADLGEELIQNRSIIELSLEGFGALNLAEGHLVAGTAEFAAGVALASGNFEKLYAGIEKTRAGLVAAKADVGASLSTTKNTSDDADVPGAGGTKHFPGPPDKAAGAAADQFQKLSTELRAQTSVQDQTAEAWKRGGVAVQALTDNWEAYRKSISLGKGATEEMRQSIEKLALGEEHAAEQAKINEEISKFSASSDEKVKFENDLAAAWRNGGIAAQGLIDKEKALEAADRLGLNASQAQRKAMEDRSLAESKATEGASHAEEIEKTTTALKENITYENALTAAYGVSAQAVQKVIAGQKAYEDGLKLGKDATDAERAALEKLAVADQTATHAAEQAAKQFADSNKLLKESIDDIGGALEKTFETLTKPSDGVGKKVKEIDKLKAALLGLGEDLQKVVLKDSFKGVEGGLNSLLSGRSGGSGNPVAGTAGGTANSPIKSAGDALGGDAGTALKSGWAALANDGTSIGKALTAGWDSLSTDSTGVGYVGDTLSAAFKTIESDLGSVFSAAFESAGTELSSIVTSALSGIGSVGSSAASGLGSLASSAVSGIGSLFGFASGGSFDVGGHGGVDSSLVAFKATPGEHVQVGGGGGGGGQNNQVVHNYTGQPAKVSKQRNSSGGTDMVMTIGDSMAHNMRSGGTLSRAVRDSFGLQRTPIQR